MKPAVMGDTHNFRSDLEFSHSMHDAPWWEIVYRKFFPDFVTMQCVRKDGWRQRAGIDRVVHLGSGGSVEIDEKVRRKSFPDIALEFYHEGINQPGWACKDLKCEFIAYAIAPTHECFLLPVRPLQMAYQRYGEDWRTQYQVIRARNDGYWTLSVCVPRNVLFIGMNRVLYVRWDDNTPAIPANAASPRPKTVSTGHRSADYARQGDLFGGSG